MAPQSFPLGRDLRVLAQGDQFALEDLKGKRGPYRLPVFLHCIA